MKFISINQLKKSQESVKKIIEDVIDINAQNLVKTKQNIESIIADLEKIKEALFYKKEGIEKELNERSAHHIIKEFSKFEKKVEQVKIQEIGPIKSILDVHKEVDDERCTYRIISILNEMLKGNIELIENLLEDEDEWKFLCVFLFCVLEESNDPEINNILKIYVKKTEEKLVNIFCEANKEKNKGLMKKSYEALKEIKREGSLIKAYMFSFSVFHENKTEKVEKETIELDVFENEENSFASTLKKLEDLYQEEFSCLSSYFSDYKNVLETLNNRIFEDILTHQLEFFLETKDPILYLLNLKIAYDKIKSLCDLVLAFYPETNVKELLEDLFHPYISNAVFKEKESLDVLFDILTCKIKPRKHYIIQSEGLYLHDFKPYKSIDKLMCIIGFSLERIDSINYDQDDKRELYQFFTKKIIDLVNYISLHFIKDDRLSLIKSLSDIFIITKKIFGDRIDLTDLENNIEERIHVIYKNRLDESEIKVKLIVKNLGSDDFTIGNTPMMQLLVQYLSEEDKNLKIYMKGQNGNMFMIQLLSFTLKRLEKQYYLFTYDKKRSDVFKNDMGLILNFIKEINVVEVISNFEYMFEISELLGVRKEDINIFMKGMFNKITEEDLRKILRCREDYQEIKNILF